MEQNHLISVIVPVYKVETYLDRCLESIVNQTYQNLEIVLVDDGSPDKCPIMCDNWAKQDSRIKVIHKKNGGLSDARNAGMKIAEGKYISFVDSDDLIDYRYIECLYNALIATDADLAACDVEEFKDEKQLTLQEKKYVKPVIATAEQALSQLIKGRGFRAVAWNKLYSREILRNEKFEYGRLHEDEFFTYRIIDKCESLAYVNLPLYKYRQREGSIMKVKSNRQLDALDAGYQRLLFLEKKYPALYLTDKITFCDFCLFVYSQAVHGEYDNSEEAKQRIKQYRRQIKFSFIEFFKSSIKCKYYILASNAYFINIFSRL